MTKLRIPKQTTQQQKPKYLETITVAKDAVVVVLYYEGNLHKVGYDARAGKLYLNDGTSRLVFNTRAKTLLQIVEYLAEGWDVYDKYPERWTLENGDCFGLASDFPDLFTEVLGG